MLRQAEWFAVVASSFVGAAVLLALSTTVADAGTRELVLVGSLILAMAAAVLMNVWGYLWQPGSRRTRGERAIGRWTHRLEARNDRAGVAALWILAALGVAILATASLGTGGNLLVGAGTGLVLVAALLLGDILESPAH